MSSLIIIFVCFEFNRSVTLQCFFKHDNNPQIPNNVVVNLKNSNKNKNKKKTIPVFTILVSIKMSNFHESSVCVFLFVFSVGCKLFAVTNYLHLMYYYRHVANPKSHYPV